MLRMRAKWVRLCKLEERLATLPEHRLEGAHLTIFVVREALLISHDAPSPPPCPAWLAASLPYADHELRRKRKADKPAKTTAGLFRQATAKHRRAILRMDAAQRRRKAARTFLPDQKAP